MAQKNLFGIDNQLKRLSDLGDQLETLDTVVDFEVFRPDLIMALHRSDGSKGGRRNYSPPRCRHLEFGFRPALIGLYGMGDVRSASRCQRLFVLHNRPLLPTWNGSRWLLCVG